uniref:Zinc finger protein 865 n=1 Tax=Stomoxys calcitrans TaxID=35570 RepID=A0A1I8QCE8_STOCA
MAFDFCFDKLLFLNTTCRSCSRFFTEDVKFYKIFQEKHKGQSGDYQDDDGARNNREIDYEPSEDIKEIFEDLVIWQLNINAMDGMPQQICVECFQRFKEVRSFREECLDSQRVLKSYFLIEDTFANVAKLSPKSDSMHIDPVLAADMVLNRDAEQDMERNTIKYGSDQGSPSSSPRLRLSPRLAELGNCIDTTSSIGTPPPLFEEIKTEPIDMETMEAIKPESELEQKPQNDEYRLLPTQGSNSCDEEESSTPTSDEEQPEESSLSSEDDDDDESLQRFQVKKRKTVKYNPRLNCKICGEACSSRQLLKTHIMRFHPQDKPFECDICTSTFKSTFMLAQHKLKHNRPDSTQCEQCGKYFRSQLHLQRHVKNFHLKSTYTCHICNQQFENYTQVRFQYHIRQHGEKRFACSFCSKAFHQKIHLINHERTHTREQPFTCDICGKAYRQKTICQEHMLTHKDPTPFKCTHCSKAFSQRSTLRMHIMRLHGMEKVGKSTKQSLLENHNFF